ncbi:hypothetical protein EV681_3331 [Advenella incenata]|uniref:Uncharacterized protein n=1 Tax=Advenella incenata TaxID=267800 RepID=A0A4Q7VFW6_9BURK|nr:hypothetical protein [Advenella incenata]RZT94893.1 hypothetical protein EV681_3331 [Advenella incenata]
MLRELLKKNLRNLNSREGVNTTFSFIFMAFCSFLLFGSKSNNEFPIFIASTVMVVCTYLTHRDPIIKIFKKTPLTWVISVLIFFISVVFVKHKINHELKIDAQYIQYASSVGGAFYTVIVAMAVSGVFFILFGFLKALSIINIFLALCMTALIYFFSDLSQYPFTMENATINLMIAILICIFLEKFKINKLLDRYIEANEPIFSNFSRYSYLSNGIELFWMAIFLGQNFPVSTKQMLLFDSYSFSACGPEVDNTVYIRKSEQECVKIRLEDFFNIVSYDVIPFGNKT